MSEPLWPDLGRRHQFFDRLRALLDEFPEIGSKMARDHAEDPTADWARGENGWPDFNPAAPMLVSGIVVITNFRNIDGYEDLAVLDPPDQSPYLTTGMLSAAIRIED